MDAIGGKYLIPSLIGDRINIYSTQDPLGISRLWNRNIRKGGLFLDGRVVTYNPQTHTALVHTDSGDIPCMFATEYISYMFGYSMTAPVMEGEHVLVMLWESVMCGVIIGNVPLVEDFSRQDTQNDPVQRHRLAYPQFPKTADQGIDGIPIPFKTRGDFTSRICTNFRPTDVYPGGFAFLNQHNCGIMGGLFSSTLMGGGASLRLSALSNLARLSCETYARHSLSASLSEFHNGRYLSSERNVAMYQEERLGGTGPGSKVWADGAERNEGGENQTMRPRMKDLTGFFGHLSSRFCLRPDPDDTETRVQGKSSPKEAGVFRETTDPSGQHRISAAGMIAIERTGRIPVPVRKAYPTDKGHDISSDPETLKPFSHNAEDPCLRQLELFDRLAYDLRNQYARVDGLGIDEKDDHDYDVPQEEDLKPLEDSYDKPYTGSSTVKLNEYDTRRAGVYVGEDGSVIIRDAWGSEISMLCGNVTISCAGNVMILPGKSQLTVAGDDIVQKAQNSVDLHASAHDVRISAARNLEMVGGVGNASPGGVVIESRGTGAGEWEGVDDKGESKGESAQLSGITLKAKGQAVVVSGDTIVSRSTKETRILSGDGEGDMDGWKGGSVSIGANNVNALAEGAVHLASGDGHLNVSDGSVRVTADSFAAYAGSSVNFTKGNKAPALQWIDSQSNPYQTMLPRENEQMGPLRKEGTFGQKAIGKMSFGFRTSEECGTDRSWSIGGSVKDFRMYEPAWHQIIGLCETLKGRIQAGTYAEKEWGTGEPFPGKKAKDSARVAMLKDGPANISKKGFFNVSRESVKDNTEITFEKLDKYPIRRA